MDGTRRTSPVILELDPAANIFVFVPQHFANVEFTSFLSGILWLQALPETPMKRVGMHATQDVACIRSCICMSGRFNCMPCDFTKGAVCGRVILLLLIHAQPRSDQTLTSHG